MSQLSIDPSPAGLNAASDFEVRVNDQPLFVYDCAVAAFTRFVAGGEVRVQITTTRPFKQVKVRPLAEGICPQVEGQTIRFSVSAGAMLSVELDGDIHRPLFLFADPPLIDTPRLDDPAVRAFAPGQVHEVGEIRLAAGQTLYIPAGTVVRGRVVADDADNIRICGRGILDGSLNTEPRSRLVVLRGCRGVRVDGITLFNSQSWTLQLHGCRDISVENLRTIGFHGSDDGIDICGCRDVVMRGCFTRTKDDCVAIKAFPYRDTPATPGQFDVHNVLIEKCVFWNAEWGNALEIGYETRTERISDITFRDCDVIRCEREGYTSGGTFTIHNGDRAEVCNVLYENIRVEDSREKLIDFKISHTRYSRDEQRGQIHDIVLRDIRIIDGELPVSIIQGFNEHHMVRNVTIENLRYRGLPIRSALEAKIVLELVAGIQFVGGERYR